MVESVPTLLQVRTGHARRLNGHVTAYAKEPRDGPVAVHELGLEGDEVGNPRVHGGPDKAVYAYAAVNYPLWVVDHPEHAARLDPGAFGENLLVSALDETNVCIGDRWRTGTALLSPCQPRQPCATLARWFDDPGMVTAMVRNGRSGWYLRVLEPGTLGAGAALVLEDRPAPAWTIARVLGVSHAPQPEIEALEALAEVPGLAAGWAAWAARTARSRQPLAKPL